MAVGAAWQDERVRLLMSIPGIDYTVAQTCLAAIGDVSRFSSPKKLASYLGLTPSTRQSATHCVHGPITKQGNAHARWLLVQAAQHLGIYRGPLGQTMRNIIRRKNRKVAVVACARKLAVLVWHVLSSREPFRYAIPKTLEAKYARLRVRATGQRRRAGVLKGSLRSPQYGHGRTRAVPSLPQVLEQNGLPAVAALPAGEKSMLAKKSWTLSMLSCRVRRVFLNQLEGAGTSEPSNLHLTPSFALAWGVGQSSPPSRLPRLARCARPDCGSGWLQRRRRGRRNKKLLCSNVFQSALNKPAFELYKEEEFKKNQLTQS